ncbi:MAG TPA: cysteine--1-D-myo-inosityl 2-amino-2-deoxy-alpha-D-glucopyranoside ligase [Mycobacteriales bacterium]|nr:cysteine--1-D-myo-inosityl 2-amino-2-deoxy-alpha-D-glucopyranoside ligase [Mycobacteriales bacterium]
MRSWPAVDVPTLPPALTDLTVQVHDTSRSSKVAVTPQEGVARLYVCGITPYDATHLGHAATYLAFDTLVRVWLDQGVEVRYVQNVTDIDDPLLERAARDGVAWEDVAERETELFRSDMTALRLLPPTWYVGAVEAMEEIAALVDRLQSLGATYTVDGDIYFSVAAADGFGGVSNLDAAQMLRLSAERGGDPERPGKKDPLDCLLWMQQRPGEPGWPSPFGSGRPGWHVECAAMALNRLGDQIDVQGGGSDLAFPHHELSAAQGEVATGTAPFAHAYVHAGMVGLDGEKMSKSLGNLVFVSRLLAAGHEAPALRLALLGRHYRADRMWTDSELTTGTERLERWRHGVARSTGTSGVELLTAVRTALYDDLDTPRALAAVDAWCAVDGDDPAAPALVIDVVDALLGVVL